MADQLAKWLTRTELQATLLVVALALLNHFLSWDLPPEALLVAVFGSSSYAVSRGLAKHEPRSPRP